MKLWTNNNNVRDRFNSKNMFNVSNLKFMKMFWSSFIARVSLQASSEEITGSSV